MEQKTTACKQKKRLRTFGTALGKGRLLAFSLLPLSFFILFLAQRNVEFAERVFARGLYPPVSQALSRVTSLLPFSLMEFGAIGLFILLIVVFCIFIRKVAQAKGKRARTFWVGVWNGLCVFSVCFFVFTVLCGVNYYRHPFSYYSGLQIEKASKQELQALCTELAGQANTLRAQLPCTQENGEASVFYKGYGAVAQDACSAMEGLATQYEVLEGWYPKPKVIFFSNLMSRMQMTGWYCPFTMEANVNGACAQYTIPATMCHELSHLRGFMREDEANFIAYLACRNAASVELRYSGTMLALVYAGNQLARQDEVLYGTLLQSYSEGVLLDFAADAAYWRQFDDTVISTASNAINDTYLKANRQTDGVQSYGRMVDLLLALRRKAGTVL